RAENSCWVGQTLLSALDLWQTRMSAPPVWSHRPNSAFPKLRRASMKKRVRLLATGSVLVAVVVFLTMQVLSAGENGTAAQEKAVPAKAPAEPKEPKRADDEAAVRKATADFIKVVEKGDAKAVAASWTEDGEYIDDDGTTLRGRAAIEAAYAKAFAKKKNPKVEITIESIRFPSK